MPFYRSLGEIPTKRHTQFRKPDGGLYHEELMGEEGFSDDSALLYHLNAPTSIINSVTFNGPTSKRLPNLPLKPRHFLTHKLGSSVNDPILGRTHMFANSDIRISYAVADQPSPLYRNAIGDECIYVESGTAVLESVFGTLPVGPGDHVLVPASTTHRWVPTGDKPLRTLVVETVSGGHINPPRRYLSERGQFLEHAPYCERDFRSPEELLVVEGSDVDVVVQHRQGWTKLTYATHPFDVIGWDGCNYPYAFNIADFEPITGRIHQPPPVHQTFDVPGAVMCAFVPRLFDYHPQAIPAPYNHANVDSDEILFYVGGDFMSRKGAGIEMGSITMHPAGFVHGPQPGSVEASIGKQATEEYAVMIDTFRPLELCEPVFGCEDSSYAWSWSGRPPAEAK